MYKPLRERGRKLNRLSHYDYSRNGWYFITISTRQKKNYFGEIKNGEIMLNQYGEIIKQCWSNLLIHYSNCRLDEFIIMPNHIHAIIVINNVRNGFKPFPTKKYSLSEIVRGFKTFSSRNINKNVYFRWQKSFYDHIIRNDIDLQRIREYIQNNPKNWKIDQENEKL